MKTETINNTLEKLGFDNKEIKVYLSLLKIGETTATKISQDTRVERTLVYYITDKLIGRGLASFKLKNNVKYYSPADPKNILIELKEKQSLFGKILPFLEQIKSAHYEGEVKVDIYKELPGLKAIVNDMFKHGKEFLVFGEEGKMQNQYPILYKQYLRKLDDFRVKEKIILREDLKKKAWKSKRQEFRYISKDMLSPTTTLIYSNKVIITIWEKPMYNIVITSKKIADSFRSYFNTLWKIAKK